MTPVDLLASVPPALVVLFAALLVTLFPRTAGYAVSALATIYVFVVSLVVPPGEYLPVVFLGFDAQLLLVDDFSRLLGLGFGFLGTAAVAYAASSGLPKSSMALVMSYVASVAGVIFAGDWLTILFFWELMAVTSTLVVWVYGGDAVRAGFRYAIAHGTGGVLLIWAVAWHYVETGSLALEGGIAPGAPALLAALGVGINCAFIGLHTWLPDTYPRPHIAASVFLSVFTTKSSAYVLYQAFPDGHLYLAYMGGLMAVYGATFALLQHDMRALLSYHIQAQLGYIVAGIGIGSAIGVAGAMAHLFNNILFKALLFMAVGVIIYRTGEEDLYELGGLWREMPLTALGYLFGALSITAIPGFNGFISKGMILDAADPHYYGAPEYEALYWLLMAGAVGTLLSFIKLGYYAFLHGPATTDVKDAKPGQTVGMLSVGVVCLGVGVFWPTFIDLLPFSAELDLHPYSPGHLTDSAVLVAIAVVGFAVIRKPLSALGHVHDVDRVLNPLVFYTGRVSVLAVTETFAAVDRAVVAVVRRCYWLANHPVLAVGRVTRRLPTWLVGDHSPANGGSRASSDRRFDGGTGVAGTNADSESARLYLRTTIGGTIMLIVLALTIVLLVLVFL
ncbi:Na(+)/H(+) antiporter subunit D [Halalkalicoccus jeotgali]|uniref:Monovalent cation/H+ antiporter subunit D n=1 Tax=Halalkalicoccus jeotgali (strain DSM 18796 / CECT 7217 / JCM 14584 / KCTC 4019 / B3) TaxID=795797 RepID=D8J661_HALJB|nr:Na(+)/H(+) antiporter subunit D [Halalkalicoccus jeotgali]ADJ15779.1 putative monovalent cation/H+ antiporter subunit D [Halalkalicoccus jeotgali B3]ELY37197.1 monovalent cation/H+ antiporter subunit D [Halalkalicoccus jeotgali B3]